MGNPIVVQGTPVNSPYATNNNNNNHTAHHHNNASVPTATATNISNPASSGKGEKQATRCRDPIFALLLYANVGIMIGIAAIYGPQAMDMQQAADNNEANNDNVDANNEYAGYVIATAICATLSFMLAGVGLAVMMCIPETLIKISLIFTVVLSGVWAAMSILSGSLGAGILGLIFFAISVCYARAVWGRIPFASVNLLTGCTAIKANLGVVLIAFFFTALAGVWSAIWTISFVGVFDKTYECDEVTNTCTDPNYGYMFLLFVSYFFTHQVLQNSIHVTVAGVVGTWWFEPSACGCCSSAVCNSFIRTMTTSFGSICFGSLVVAIIRALQMLASAAQENDDGGFLVCIAECLLSCLAAIVEYFNKWAFIYVGIYGYGYVEAGKNVFTLFRDRGWEAIIADDLVNNTLFLVSLIIGGIMGSIAIVIEVSSELFQDAGGDAKAIAFFLGFIVGLVITSIAMSTIASAVNSVIVLFAEAPAELQQNHPTLSRKMRQTWSEIYPGSV